MHNLPPKLVIEMLPDEEENLSLFERIKNSITTTVKRKSSDGSNSTSSESEDRRDSIKSSASLSISSVDLSNRRASSASTFGNEPTTCYLTDLLYSTFAGNHGTFGPVFSSTSDLMVDPGRREKCPLTRCLSAREARMVKRSKSTRALEVNHFARPSEQHRIWI